MFLWRSRKPSNLKRSIKISLHLIFQIFFSKITLPWIPSHFPSFSRSPLYERYTAMLSEVSFGRFWVGSQFFILACNHAVLVVEERKLWRKCEEPWPEEHYLPTLLSMKDWTGCWDGHPHLYSPEEVSALNTHIEAIEFELLVLLC